MSIKVSITKCKCNDKKWKIVKIKWIYESLKKDYMSSLVTEQSGIPRVGACKLVSETEPSIII
jgi:hypothetical protein